MKNKNDYIDQRVLEVANYIISTGATVRETSKKFNVSKSTIHKDATERIEKVNPQIAKLVLKVLQTNLEERAVRGGQATKLKYLQ